MRNGQSPLELQLHGYRLTTAEIIYHLPDHPGIDCVTFCCFGNRSAELHRQAEELGLMEHGTFLGWIGDDVLHSLYRIAELTVVPSIYEPFGLVALEAMASECPCIAADTGGLREVVPVDGAGLRFRASDPEHLAEAAIQVLSDRNLSRRMVEEGLDHIQLFDWSDVARQTLALYGELTPLADRA